MNPALWAALGGATALLLLLLGAGVATLLVGHRARVRQAASEDAARADLELLRARVEELSAELGARSRPADPAGTADFVITTAGAPEDRSSLPQVPEHAVLSVTLGQPLVKLAAFGHGLRRALSPESRNRIAFEMRREVRRSRKARRRAARRARVATGREEAA